ncbi:MAG: cation-transporting P-type ATPase [Acidimicrobiia bacterium]
MSDRADVEPGSLDVGRIGQLTSSAWWATNLKDLQASLRSDHERLSSRDADARSGAVGKNLINPRREVSVWTVLPGPFRSLLVLILVFARPSQ